MFSDHKRDEPFGVFVAPAAREGAAAAALRWASGASSGEERPRCGFDEEEVAAVRRQVVVVARMEKTRGVQRPGGRDDRKPTDRPVFRWFLAERARWKGAEEADVEVTTVGRAAE